MYDYKNEPKRDILCIDMKSFYASVECVDRGLNPLTTMLVVMSNAENTGGLILASSPLAKSKLGIKNVSRKFSLPDHPDLIIVPPRMSLYIEKNMYINNIYRTYVSDDDLHIYSVDESFLDVTNSHLLFGNSTYNIAKQIKEEILSKTGLYCTIGIGDNPLLAKLALDNEAKHNTDFIAEWHYDDVPRTVWSIYPMRDMWGIGRRTEKRLHSLGIRTIQELANYDTNLLKERIGTIGVQLQASAWGIDRSKLSNKYSPKEKSYGNSQILPRDYTEQIDIEIVLREMTDYVAARLRKHHCQTQCIHLSIGFSSLHYSDGFSHQLKIPATSNTKKLTCYILDVFRENYKGEPVRNIGISYSKLIYETMIQLSLFDNPERQVNDDRLNFIVDTIRNRYGFSSLVHASSLLEGGTAIYRSSLVGGHAGGIE